MIALPPLLVGADHTSVTDWLSGVPATAVTRPGVDRGVTDDEAVEYELVPAAFVAATRNTYGTPFDNPVTVADAVADVPSANVVQLAPLFDEN